MHLAQIFRFALALFQVWRRALATCASGLALICCGFSAVEAVTLNPGDLVVGDSRTPVRVSVVNPQAKSKTVVCDCTALGTIKSVAVKGNEKIYAIGQLPGSTTQAVVAIDPVSGAQTVVSSGGNFKSLQGIALELDGSILVSDNAPATATSPLLGSVIRVHPLTGQQTVLSSGDRMPRAWSVSVGSSGEIFVAATISFPAGVLPNSLTLASGVLRIDPGNGQQTVVAYGDDMDLAAASRTEMISASDLAVDQTGNIFVLDKRYRGSNLEDETRLIKIDSVTGAQTMLTNSLKGVDRTKSGFDFRGIAILNGVLYAADYRLSETGLPGISRFDPSIGFREGVTSDGFLAPTGIAVVPPAVPVTTTTTAATTTTTTTTTAQAPTTTTTLASTTSTTLAPVAIDFAPGWNLAGNSSSASLDVAAAFGDAGKTLTIWKWVAAAAKWAFFAPSLAGQALNDYAAGRGYDVLSGINAGEGFWVNAKVAFSAPLPAGAAVTSTSFQNMASGWNLVATGDNRTPGQFNVDIGTTPPAAGVVAENLTTLWAWDATLANWYFYAPSLENSGGLASYIASKSYLDFGTRTLLPGTGFWVNKH